MSARLVRALTLMQSGRKLLSTERKMLKRVRRKRKKRLSIFNAPTDRKRSLTSISPLLMSLVEVAAEVVDVTAVTALIVETDQIVVTDPIAVTDLIVEIVTVKIVVELPVVVDLAVEAVAEAIVDLVVAAERKSSS